MKEIPFSIPVSGVVRISEDSITIVVNQTETSISLKPDTRSGRRALEPGVTLYDVILDAAREMVRQSGFNRFSAPELYREALSKHPGLKRNSFMTRIIACTPNHSSYKYNAGGKDYLSHIGPGLYKLNDRYVPDKSFTAKGTLFNS